MKATTLARMCLWEKRRNMGAERWSPRAPASSRQQQGTVWARDLRGMGRDAERCLLAIPSVPVCLWGSTGEEARTQHSGTHANSLESGTGKGRKQSDKSPSLSFLLRNNLKRKCKMKQEWRYQGKVIAGRRAAEICKEEPEEALPTGYKDRGSDKKRGAEWAVPCGFGLLRLFRPYSDSQEHFALTKISPHLPSTHVPAILSQDSESPCRERKPQIIYESTGPAPAPGTSLVLKTFMELNLLKCCSHWDAVKCVITLRPVRMERVHTPGSVP